MGCFVVVEFFGCLHTSTSVCVFASVRVSLPMLSQGPLILPTPFAFQRLFVFLWVELLQKCQNTLYDQEKLFN